MNIGSYTRKLSDYMIYMKYRKTTIDQYISCVGKFLNHFELVATKPSEISAEQISKYLSLFKSSNTHKVHLGAIKLFYDKIGNQPKKLDNVQYPKKSNRLPVVLSVYEVQQMFEVCENTKHKVILTLLYALGLRAGELINLQWKDIDRSRMIINVVDGKGGKDRQVFLPDQIIPLLIDYYREYKPLIYVLNGQFKDQYSKTSVLNVVKNTAIKAGIKKNVYTHLMRHCTFTHMVEQGTDINLIQRIAGHKNVKTTAVYCHISHNMISQIKSPIENIKI